jgi:two-component system sensor histidine kinase HydH
VTWRPNSRDAVWILLFLALHYSSRIVNDAEAEMLIALAAVEIIEPRIAFFNEGSLGRLCGIGLRLIFGYLLIGVTGGIESSYYLILMLPVVRGASLFGAWASAGICAVSALSYPSFLLYLDFSRMRIAEDQQQEIISRVLFLLLAGYLTYQLARANREQAERFQGLAAELAETNTNLKSAQSEVRRSERLAALGQLTAGLAHELRNPLGTIKNSAELLAQRIPAGDALGQELSGYISSEVDRTNDLIKRFLDFARPFRLRIEMVEIAEVIDRAIQQVEARAQAKAVTILRNDSPDLEPAPVDGQWVEALLANLLANAIDASPAGSTVTVSSKPAEGGIELSVVDRGHGIAAETLPNIFNPFFTTKPDGTGLGLAIVSKVVDEHGGRIAVESRAGEGSQFRIWLPDRSQPGEGSK